MTRQALVAAVSAVLAVGFAQARGTALISDLSITKTDRAATYTAGVPITYAITVGNAGPDPVAGATVSDPVTALAQVASASWTCVAAGGATCTAGPVSGNIGDTVDLPVGGTATYTLVVKTSAAATGDLVTTATVTPPSGTADPGPAPNTATDTDTPATIIYVATTGEDSATCGASASPCKTIQAAIDRAEADNTVVVRNGSYKECVAIVPGIGVGGILVVSAEYLSSGSSALAVLDGAGTCDDASGTPGPVVTIFDRSRLLGFTIQNGGDSGVRGLGAVTISANSIVDNRTSSTGGGIRLTTGAFLSDPLAKAEITANVIQNNTSGRDGAGIFVSATGSGVPSVVTIDGNTIATNTAGDGSVGVSGSALTVFSDTASAADSSSVVITKNTLDGNVAKNAAGNAALAYGGGIFVSTGTIAGLGTETVAIGRSSSGNIVRNNVSEGFGGGVSVRVQPAPAATHTVDVVANTITANTGKRGGGGIHLFAHAFDRIAGATPGVVVRATGNSLVGNHAQGDLSDPGAVGGGGIHAELRSERTAAAAVQFDIAGNTIERNDASTHGGGASLLAWADDDPHSDGATAPTEAVISFRNNLVAENAASDTTAGVPSGGGVHGRTVARGASALARLSHDFLTVVNNRTELGTGGLEWQDLLLSDSLGGTGAASFMLSNSIVTGNQGYGVGTTAPLDPAAAVEVSYTDAFGNISGNYQSPLSDPTGTNGNISEDAELDALYLPRLCGPAVDRGDPARDATIEPLPNGGRVNLGHLGNTSSATRTFPDVNGDGTIDGLDVLGVAVSFNSCSDLSCSDHARFLAAADRDLNNRVDGEDLAYVAGFYAQTCP